MQISVFSQSSYPKKILWENDTVLTITKKQLIYINRSLNDYLHLQEVNKKLQVELVVLDSTVVSLKKLNEIERKSYLLAEEKFLKQSKISDELSKALKKEKNRKIKTGICVGAGGALVGAMVGMLLIK